VLSFVYCVPFPSPGGTKSSLDSGDDKQECSGKLASRGFRAPTILSSPTRGSANEFPTTRNDTPSETPPAPTSTGKRSDKDICGDGRDKGRDIFGTYGTLPIGTQSRSPPGRHNPAPIATSTSSKSLTASVAQLRSHEPEEGSISPLPS